MATEKVPQLYERVLRITRVHFLYVLAFAFSIVVYDSSMLIAPEAVLQRWKYATALLIVITAVWFAARRKKENNSFQHLLIALLVCADIVFASLLVYADRGMASLAVALYAIPIVTAAVSLSRSAVMAAATFSIAGYGLATMKYFVDFFNEGYKVQLYSSIGFYGLCFLLIAMLLTIVIQDRKS